MAHCHSPLFFENGTMWSLMWSLVSLLPLDYITSPIIARSGLRTKKSQHKHPKPSRLQLIITRDSILLRVGIQFHKCQGRVRVSRAAKLNPMFLSIRYGVQWNQITALHDFSLPIWVNIDTLPFVSQNPGKCKSSYKTYTYYQSWLRLCVEHKGLN